MLLRVWQLPIPVCGRLRSRLSLQQNHSSPTKKSLSIPKDHVFPPFFFIPRQKASFLLPISYIFILFVLPPKWMFTLNRRLIGKPWRYWRNIWGAVEDTTTLVTSQKKLGLSRTQEISQGRTNDVTGKCHSLPAEQLFLHWPDSSVPFPGVSSVTQWKPLCTPSL